MGESRKGAPRNKLHAQILLTSTIWDGMASAGDSTDPRFFPAFAFVWENIESYTVTPQSYFPFPPHYHFISNSVVKSLKKISSGV